MNDQTAPEWRGGIATRKLLFADYSNPQGR